MSLKVSLWPTASITGSDKIGTGAVTLIVLVVLVWLAIVRPPFLF